MSVDDAIKLAEYINEISDTALVLKKEFQGELDQFPAHQYFIMARSDMDNVVFHMAALGLLIDRVLKTVLEIVTDNTNKSDENVAEYLDTFQSFFAEIETYKRSS
jgi:predicted nucleotidyltransferase